MEIREQFKMSKGRRFNNKKAEISVLIFRFTLGS